MNLAEHVEEIRKKIDSAYRNRLGRMGITAKGAEYTEKVASEYLVDRQRIDPIFGVFLSETGTLNDAFEKLVEEFTFTLFNRLAALKVMEALVLIPEVVTRRTQNANRSTAHAAWLEENPDGFRQESDGLLAFLEAQFSLLGTDIPLFDLAHPYHLFPTAVELNTVIDAFNNVEADAQVGAEIWKSDDILGWLYESFNETKKSEHKASKKKIEHHNVSLRSQTYTPRWVVKFLVDNSLGKLYLEMFPDSPIKHKYKIANAPTVILRPVKPLTEIRMIDPATGSANFLLYGFDLFYDLYLDQIETYGADYDERKIPQLILENNLFGIDLDDRAVQLAHLGLFIKAKRRRRSFQVTRFNIVSSDFFLPPYSEVKTLFNPDGKLKKELESIVQDLWLDLQQAHKFGSLLRLEEKFAFRLEQLMAKFQKEQPDFFGDKELATYETFRTTFFGDLEKAVAAHQASKGVSFLNTKTRDALTFLKLMTQKYDVAVANPPYTDSSDFGADLKKFVDANYSKPLKFNSNLYATFVKRTCELVGDGGKVGMVHPPTFMYIKTFEDLRAFIVSKMHIPIFVEWGYLGMFNPSARVDSAMYVLEKRKGTDETIFIKLNDIYEGHRLGAFIRTYEDLVAGRTNSLLYKFDQTKFEQIEGQPFIYWISDEFRAKFLQNKLNDFVDNCQGLATSDNNRFVRFWWEIVFQMNDDNEVDLYQKKWHPYAKGGPFNKWFGNLWTVVDFEYNGREIRELCNQKYSHIKGYQEKWVVKNEEYYFKQGITYSASGSKGVSFRLLPSNHIFDVGGSCLFPTTDYKNLNYIIGLLNSNIASYVLLCLNPTVNTQVGDIQRIPFVKPSEKLEFTISNLSLQNIKLKRDLCSFRIVESEFSSSPLRLFESNSLSDRIRLYLHMENQRLATILVNEALINEKVFEVYSLKAEDRKQIEAKMGKSIGTMAVLTHAKAAFLAEANDLLPETKKHIQDLPETDFSDEFVQTIKSGFETLYQTNNDLESFCTDHKVNPINVWYWFKEAKVVPPGRAKEIALEFLADAIRTLLKNDDDGIIPLVGFAEETRLYERLEQYCHEIGFTPAQFQQLDGLLGKRLELYLEENFFEDLSNHLNLFMYLPKTPFIWHLSSGSHKGFEVYISIYRWTKDSLFRLKAHYIQKRVERLRNREMGLQGNTSAAAQNEIELIRNQLDEIQKFTQKIDALINEGYNPVLDSGVGKNIAPLQAKKMLKADVLSKTQLEKYLKADW
jgi:hypothetical protein